MVSSLFNKLSVALSLATYVTGAKIIIVPRAAQVCYSTETTAQLCYTAPNNTPQDVAVADIADSADYLRAYGAETEEGRLFTMLAADGDDCPEWVLYSHGSVLITAKHINSAVNSSVLFADIATTIDGGAAATAGLIDCGTDGGSEGVLVDATNPAYTTSTYLGGGFTPDGILIKVVASGN